MKHNEPNVHVISPPHDKFGLKQNCGHKMFLFGSSCLKTQQQLLRPQYDGRTDLTGLIKFYVTQHRIIEKELFILVGIYKFQTTVNRDYKRLN